ncbi:MAG TPA: hypothetical protein VFP35_03755 [Candidatus Saccharimonadales bacterium]|nr:hypothetical protein [Candidatus Saccharimonadales bacterium]
MDSAGVAVNPKTVQALEEYLNAPSQVLAIIGPPASGKLELAQRASAKLLDLDNQKLANYPYFFKITTQDGQRDISIDSVRLIIKELKSKVPGESPIRRIVLIESAYRLSQEAQNALLKTLEQPNPETVFVLTLNSPAGILPTVLSRAQKLTVYPISLMQAKKHYSSFSPAEVEQAWLISEGLAGELHSLLTGPDTSIKDSLALAKTFLSQDSYHRLLSLDSLSKTRQSANEFLTALAKLLKTLHHANIKKDNRKLSARILTSRKLTAQTTEAINASAGTKLALLNLITNLPL